MPKLYRPSGGTEGMAFMDKFCDRCIRDSEFSEHTTEEGCLLLANSMAFDMDDPEYPQEWIYNENGRGICTEFILDGSKEAEDDQIKRNQKQLEAAGQERLF